LTIFFLCGVKSVYETRVYVETSVISYLTARPSRDVIVLAHQEITRQCWESGRGEVHVVISDFVEQEAAAGNLAAAKDRMDVVAQLARIDIDHRVDVRIGNSIA
jgi:hypothetical protein